MSYTAILPPETCINLLLACISALESPQPLPVQISAIESIGELFKKLGDERKDLMIPHLERTTAALLRIATRVDADVLSLILDALTKVIKMHAVVAVHFESQLGAIINACFLKFHQDPFVSDAVVTLVQAAAEIPEMIPSLESRLLTTMMSIIDQHEREDLAVLTGHAVSVLEAIVSGCPEMTSGLLDIPFPSLVRLLLNSGDIEALQYGVDCLRAYIRKAAPILQTWSNGEASGYQLILTVFQRLLHPEMPDSASMNVGKTVTQFLKKAVGLDASIVHGIFDAVLLKLDSIKMQLFQEEMIFVIAQWIIMDTPSALEYLASRDAMQRVFELWCDGHESFTGKYAINTSAVALAYVFKSGDARLMSITVKGDEIHYSSGIRTRAKAAHTPQRFTEIPLLAKIAKLLIREYGEALEEEQMRLHGDDFFAGEDDDDDDDEWEDEDAGAGGGSGFARKSPFAPAEGYDLSDAIDIGLSKYIYDDDEVIDHDAQEDPVFQINLGETIQATLREIVANEEVVTFLMPSLTEEEKRTAMQAAA